MTPVVTEADVEQAALDWFAGLGYVVLNGHDLAPDMPAAERAQFDEVVLAGRLRDAIVRLNPAVPTSAQDDAFRKATRISAASLALRNRAFHWMLVDGVEVEHPGSDGRIVGDRVRLIDFEDPDANDWLAVNQLTVVRQRKNRRPDLVVFVNGLPLAVFELKDPSNEQATIRAAFNQLQTYKLEIDELFAFNEVLVISDGAEARIGSLTAHWERFMPWRTIEGEHDAPATTPELEVLIRGVFDRRRFLDYLRYFVAFEDEGAEVVKKLAGYHQFHAVNVAVQETVRAAGVGGDRRIGVVWHTQGSGKSLTMLFYAGRIAQHPAMANPTIVVLTYRNDLDDQLFGTFARGAGVLRQTPVQAASRDDLRRLLSQRQAGGVFFTTIQKFLPEGKSALSSRLSDRRNIVVIADEAHRSQYEFKGGLAAHLRDALPHASFIGFTGTPIELEDRSTRRVFGDYISIYDVERAQQDGAIVPIYYESRLAKLQLDEAERPHLDADFEEVTEGEEVDRKEQLKTKWAALEAVVGSEQRIALVAEDLVKHFEERLAVLDGKAMVVCMSRRICVELYRAIARLRPEWDTDDDVTGAVKIVMTGSAADGPDWQRHIRNRAGRDALAGRFKKLEDPLQLVIVREMWLTGFDIPPLHTMYVDKPMRGHTLMQAIARVNRVFRDKPGGLVVDYLGIANELRQAVQTYTASGGHGDAVVDQNEAVGVLLEKVEIVRGRNLVKRTLRKYGYPPDKQEKAVKLVIEQAEALSAPWAA